MFSCANNVESFMNINKNLLNVVGIASPNENRGTSHVENRRLLPCPTHGIFSSVVMKKDSNYSNTFIYLCVGKILNSMACPSASPLNCRTFHHQGVEGIDFT